MKRLIPVISILFLPLISCSLAGTQSSSTTTGEISGVVIDSRDGSPIPYANVITEPPTSSVTTNSDGKYSIPDVHPGDYRIIAIKPDNTSRDVRVAVKAGEKTTADLHFGIDQTYLPTTTPSSSLVATATAVNTPVFFGSNMLANGNLDENDFGIIANWANTNVDLHRWYLVQDVQPGQDTKNARWIEWVELSDDERGYGLKSTDYQNCNYFCSTSAVQIVPAQENRAYTLSAEAMREQGKGGSLYIDFLNASRGRIKAHSKGGYTEEWSRQENTAVAPKGTRYIRVILYTSNKSQGIVYWDNVELRENE
jgi:hypothetical protein